MQANTNSSTPQLATFMLPAMGCHVQISLNITQLSLQQTQGNTDQEIDQKIDQKVALVKVYEPPRLYRRLIYLSQAATPDRIKLS